MMLFDVSPLAGGIGIGLAVAFFLLFALFAFIAFRMLKKTFKMAVRMAIVAVIMLIAVIGGIALLLFSSSGTSKPARPPVKTTR
jgi:peptidoglycan/LPS O-acetylase OafA/YrhL